MHNPTILVPRAKLSPTMPPRVAQDRWEEASSLARLGLTSCYARLQARRTQVPASAVELPPTHLPTDSSKDLTPASSTGVRNPCGHLSNRCSCGGHFSTGKGRSSTTPGHPGQPGVNQDQDFWSRSAPASEVPYCLAGWLGGEGEGRIYEDLSRQEKAPEVDQAHGMWTTPFFHLCHHTCLQQDVVLVDRPREGAEVSNLASFKLQLSSEEMRSYYMEGQCLNNSNSNKSTSTSSFCMNFVQLKESHLTRKVIKW